MLAANEEGVWMRGAAFARGAILFGLLASGPFGAGSAGAQVDAQGANARERPNAAQALNGDFIRAFIDANGGCSAWNSMLRTPEWTRGAPFGKTNTEWTDADFQELEAILSGCIDQTMGRQSASNPEYAGQIKRSLRNDVEARRQQVARTAGQDQRQRDARANAERAVQDARSTAEARRQEEARAREQRFQEALARREEQARQAQAGQVRRAEEQADAFLAHEAARRQQEQQPQQGRTAQGQPRAQQIAPGLQGLTNAVSDARRAYCAVSPANTGRTAGAQLFLARFLGAGQRLQLGRTARRDGAARERRRENEGRGDEDRVRAGEGEISGPQSRRHLVGTGQGTGLAQGAGRRRAFAGRVLDRTADGVAAATAGLSLGFAGVERN